ncbi:hypothetical protein T310_8355 [Rasamsonia emersonii CBS 393.64]|uniref:Uncharacterized protein n=1 Tax=Rasamsonia emersonii (strain ATCC 16479 / CBS 393.64 / IMI 116815) TaxID=1408163 RepID=A0A0F4YIL5_RASE3|nr:hypothetical protein T310_8355 [Rasamsonia emersonii CBS 393.64]KKA17701.1 hypothetical protein T310_8355 [Rasamsonia emersonii CBS 393.64]
MDPQQRIMVDTSYQAFENAGFKLPRSKYEFGLCLFEQPRRFAHRLSGSAEWHIMIIRSVRQYRQIYTLHALIGSRNAVVIVDNALHYLNSTDSTATIALWTSVWGDQPASLEYIITSQEQKFCMSWDASGHRLLCGRNKQRNNSGNCVPSLPLGQSATKTASVASSNASSGFERGRCSAFPGQAKRIMGSGQETLQGYFSANGIEYHWDRYPSPGMLRDPEY